jgi:hypothetical protein
MQSLYEYVPTLAMKASLSQQYERPVHMPRDLWICRLFLISCVKRDQTDDGKKIRAFVSYANLRFVNTIQYIL